MRSALQGLVWTSIVLCFLVFAPGLDPQRFKAVTISQFAFRLLLSALSRPTIHHEGFWSSLSKQVDLELFTPLGRVLGRSHRSRLHKGMKALSLETEDFARQCIDLYEALSGKAAKQYQTPHVDPGSLVVSDDVPRGELSASAARMVMKLLWLARLSRPDVLVAVTLLAVKVTTWSSGGEIGWVCVLLC